MTKLTPAEQRDKQYRELAAAIADKAQAIADGTLTGPLYAQARLILRSAEQLVAETPDDRSGMPGAQPAEPERGEGAEPGIHDHVLLYHPRVDGFTTETAKEMGRRHGADHHKNGSTTHHHGWLPGADARPRGWRDGSGVVLIDRQAAMRRRPATTPDQED